MTGFILGIILTVAFTYGNSAAKDIMSKVHANNKEEMAKMKLPGYAIYSYIMFIKERANDN